MTDNLKEALYTKVPLKFNENGKYKILMISDIHGGVGFAAKKTVAAIQALLDVHKPDLVLLGGDIAGPGYIHIENQEQLKEMLFCTDPDHLPVFCNITILSIFYLIPCTV